MLQQELSKLNKEQLKAVKHKDGPIIVVAGAGTGKTKVITLRFVWLCQELNIQPENILALTFTDKATFEMVERIDILMPYGFYNFWINTFHKFGERILREYGDAIGVDSNFKVLSITDQLIFFSNNLDKFEFKYFDINKNSTGSIFSILNHISRCKDENISPTKYLKWVEEMKLNNDAREILELQNIKSFSKLSDQEQKQSIQTELQKHFELAEIYYKYQQLMLENNYLDFGDLLFYTFKLLKEKPNILQKCRDRFRYILVDEFQDTNTIQYEIVKLLAYPDNNLMVVGDDDQSIYRFRGASIENILKFKEDYPNAKEVVLTQNYRSVQKILDLAYKSIQNNNPYRLEYKLKINKKLKSNIKNQGVVEHIHTANFDEELYFIVDKILQIKTSEPHIKWSDFAILFRSNQYAKNFFPILRAKNIPFYFVGTSDFYNQQIIIEIISFLRVLNNYNDDPALKTLLESPILNINKTDLSNLDDFRKRKGLNFYETLEQINLIPKISEQGLKNLEKIKHIIDKNFQYLRNGKKIFEIILNFLNDIGYNKEFIENQTLELQYMIEHINKILEKIKTYEQNFLEANLEDFIQLIKLEIDVGETNNKINGFNEDKVNLLTIHSSKGLEFDYVFIPNLVSQRFPATNKKKDINIPKSLLKDKLDLEEKDLHLQEERRLFYVAITRAKKHLYLTSSQNYGGVKQKKISKFLEELGFDNKVNKIITIDKLPIFNTQDTNTNFEQTSLQHIPEHFSFTQIKIYDLCPLRYKLIYIDKLPTKGNAKQSFGQSLHKTLEIFIKRIIDKKTHQQINLFQQNNINEQNILPSKEELYKIFEQYWIDEWYTDKQEQEKYKQQGKNILSEFYEKIKQQDINKFYKVEQNFKIKIQDYIIKGRIDRIDKDGNNLLYIIDYKTREKKKSLTTYDKFQLILYKLAIEQLLKQEIKKLSYYYLQDNQEIDIKIKEKDIEKFMDWVLTCIQNILSQNYKAKPGSHCKYCEFKYICKYK